MTIQDSEASLKLRKPRVGDNVTIHNMLCEWDRVDGTIISISDRPGDEMPYMVQRSNYDVWPFDLPELELHSLDEAYDGGWLDPRLAHV